MPADTAMTTGQTYASDNAGDHWIGTAGDDTFNLGRGGDVVSGDGGDDTFKFAEIPWAGGHITDFGAGDALDLTGLLATTGETGTNALADGYLMVAGDGSGGSDIYARYDTGSSWWLVTDLNLVAPSRVQFSNGVFTAAPPPSSAVSTSASTYAAPPGIDSITLTGSQQTVSANNADDTTVWSNNTRNTITGGTGDDVIHIGRGGDIVTGGYGKDVFAFAETPWAGAVIKDFRSADGDSIDVSGLLARAGYTGSDPAADGFLKQTTNGGADQIWANYNQPGNDGWWLVATVNGIHSPMALTDRVFHVGLTGGTVTVSGDGIVPDGYDRVIVTGSGVEPNANTAGDTFIDQGTSNILLGGYGNDTFVFAPHTRSVMGFGGVDAFILNAHPTSAPSILDPLDSQDRIDVSQLLAGAGYTGNDPLGQGYLQIVSGDDWGRTQPGVVRANLMFDPDGSAGPAAATLALAMGYNPSTQHFEYQDGVFHLV